MFFLLFLVPVMAIVSSAFLYRQNGKREILRFDFVQFIYAFVISPAVFLWLKFFVFFLLRRELNLKLSVSNLFVIDSAFSILFIYLFAFVVIHSLTKTFSLKRTSDPLYDMFAHSEYFHFSFSHLAIYIGAMLVATMVSLLNVWIPFDIFYPKTVFYGLLSTGVLVGVGGFWSCWVYKSPSFNFMRIMKLCFGLIFLAHLIIYFIYDLSFSMKYGMYWLVFNAFLSATFLSLFAEKPEKPSGFLQSLPFHLNIAKPKHLLGRFKNYAQQLLKQE
jgi:hypothetical protein